MTVPSLWVCRHEVGMPPLNPPVTVFPDRSRLWRQQGPIRHARDRQGAMLCRFRPQVPAGFQKIYIVIVSPHAAACSHDITRSQRLNLPRLYMCPAMIPESPQQAAAGRACRLDSPCHSGGSEPDRWLPCSCRDCRLVRPPYSDGNPPARTGARHQRPRLPLAAVHPAIR